MRTQTFNELRKLVYENSGITLGPTKVALVTSRIGRRLRSLNLPDEEAYLALLKSPGKDEEFIHFIDAISTNVTSFYREPDHFEFMMGVMGAWISQGQRKFRIWCAAASTGEEPYTLAITALEAMKGRMCDVKILATDISTQVLQRCKEGVYKADKLEAVPPRILTTYFERVPGENGTDLYRAAAALKSVLTFSRLNLSVTPFPMKGPMDLIFIRNVMIYFDDELRKRLLAEARRLLQPDGYLIVGHSEGLTGLVSDFKLVRPSVYQTG